ncbi:MAG: aspartate-semialdehyde dehydrogenase [Chlorobi bacterium]|nr:aspartate-semialdehyde dehydrogenase [Chlorobiota bacterium]
MSFRVAIVGATGLVGRTMLDVLAERQFPIAELRLFASERSAGTIIEWKNLQLRVEPLTMDVARSGFDIALFSAGSAVSREYAPLFANYGTTVVDNSSAWRTDPNVPLVVPEVNAHRALEHHGIIANPNCSTIQLAVALAPIERLFNIVRVVVATYQSVSGAGARGLAQLDAELAGTEPTVRISSHPIAHNTVFHPIADDGWSEEERKMMRELRRIMDRPDMAVIATCVRLPIYRSHAEAVWVECQHQIELPALIELYRTAAGIEYVPENYPTPLTASGTNAVWIGRLRPDPSNPHALALWVVADNVRKGAATNAVQILEVLVQNGRLSPAHSFAELRS